MSLCRGRRSSGLFAGSVWAKVGITLFFPLPRPSGLRSRRLEWQRLDVGYREPQPAPYGALIQCRWIDVDIAFHPAAPHFHRPCAGARERLALAVVPDAQQKAALGRACDNVSVAQARENPMNQSGAQ